MISSANLRSGALGGSEAPEDNQGLTAKVREYGALDVIAGISTAPAPSPIGARYGRLTVIGRVHIMDSSGGRYDWQCRCDCGTVKTFRQRSVKSGHTQSCSCLNRERVSGTHRRHGMSHLPVYLNWQTMIQRCENPKVPHYHRYGGRGITVCDRWKVFENFYEDMGDRPSSSHSIDRIDNDRGYSPNNCRWATSSEQNLNTRRSKAKRMREVIKEACLSMNIATENVRRDLITMANRCTVPTLARRYRDLATMLCRFETASGWVAENLRKSIARIIDEIGQIKRDGFYHNRLRELLSGPRNAAREAGQ